MHQHPLEPPERPNKSSNAGQSLGVSGQISKSGLQDPKMHPFRSVIAPELYSVSCLATRWMLPGLVIECTAFEIADFENYVDTLRTHRRWC